MPRRTLWLILAAAVISIACYERRRSQDRNRRGRQFHYQQTDSHHISPLCLCILVVLFPS